MRTCEKTVQHRRAFRLKMVGGLLIGIWFSLTVRPAHAGDLYTLFDGSCHRTVGVLVHVDSARVLVIGLSGRLTTVPRNQISSVVLHHLLENPLAEIVVDRQFKSFLRDVWIGDDRQVSFTGWPTSFFDDLLIFTDTNGKTHVIDPVDVARIADTSLKETILKPSTHAVPELAYPVELVPCASAASVVGTLPPSRVIADRIKLGDHFTKLAQSYQAIDEFEERTRVYAKPFVFDDSARIGLFFHQDMPLRIPFYFRWANGRPYRFQSQTVLGNTIHDWLPFMTPTLSITSDAKSHFFNATFVGNILALPAGNNAFALKEQDEEDGDFPGGGNRQQTRVGVDVSYNYLILMGVDYWRLSVSAGPAYLSTRFTMPRPVPTNQQPLEHRRVDAEKLSPTVRLRYQGAGLDLRALYFHTKITAKRKGFLFDRDGNMLDLGTFRLRSDALRLGATIALFRQVSLALDQIITKGKYSEHNAPLPSLSLSYFYSDSNIQLSSDFGRFVTVRAYARLLIRHHNIKRPTTIGNDNRNDMRFGAALEFSF